ncbi:PEP-utilizing enzyme [Streptomyces sp. CA-250714]|uniref:PEP-utilizing enzyme n=1 Tax=Streptomyces sp. CA-250714 TaxID=3240060 RepID=UPI003D8AA0A8
MSVADTPQGPLHSRSGPDTYWSTTNVGEAFPGVVTPLGWSLCGPGVEVGIRDSYARVGALPRKEVRVPAREEDRLISVFFGRGALNVNFFCRMGANLPGSAPDAIARQFLGELPADLPARSTLRRLPAVAVKMPCTQATVRRDVLRRAAPVKGWWQQWAPRFDTLDPAGSRHLLAEARDRFTEMLRVQAAGLFIGVQSVYDRLLALIDRAELPQEQTNALVSGQGSHAELELINDLWSLGRGRLTLEHFLAEHGFHGPDEGEVSSRVWREDPTPVLRLAEQYAALDEHADPEAAAVRRAHARREAERCLIAALPRRQRPAARFVLNLAVSRIPMRGVAKAAFLQALDVARGAARQLGAHLAEQGVLDDAEDVFCFTVDELTGTLPADAAAVAAERRAQREAFQATTLPAHWQGNPEPIHEPAPEPVGGARGPVRGIGASGGVVEGTVRVVDDPAFADIEPGDVLVCATTDPSWASALFLSSALVVDVGGLLSHAAVVARELGVPCVVGTGDGTKALRTGDHVRVHGNEGTVEILSGAESVAANGPNEPVELNESIELNVPGVPVEPTERPEPVELLAGRTTSEPRDGRTANKPRSDRTAGEPRGHRTTTSEPVTVDRTKGSAT